MLFLRFSFCGSELLLASLFSTSVTLFTLIWQNPSAAFSLEVVSFSISGFLWKTKKMGLSNFPSPAEGVLPVLLMNTVLSVALLKNLLRSVFQVMSNSNASSPNIEEDPDELSEIARDRRISITQFKSLCYNRSSVGRTSSGSASGLMGSMECCVCLCGFEADEEVSELSCKHFFHKGCLEKWFDNKHTTCPLCRSID